MRVMFILLVAFAVLFPGEAHAYIDPGSGSAIMSAIIGFFVAAGLVVKTFWYKIKAVFTGKKPEQTMDQQPGTDNEE